MGSGERRRKREVLKGFPIRAFSSYCCGGEMHNNSWSKKKKPGVFSSKIQNRWIFFFFFPIPPLSTTVPASPIWLDEDIQTAQRYAACAFAASVYPPSNAFTIATDLPGILNEPLPERSC